MFSIRSRELLFGLKESLGMTSTEQSFDCGVTAGFPGGE
jgi:hypothetical protein